jgi:hypothetical protein
MANRDGVATGDRMYTSKLRVGTAGAVCDRLKVRRKPARRRARTHPLA